MSQILGLISFLGTETNEKQYLVLATLVPSSNFHYLCKQHSQFRYIFRRHG